MNFKDFLNICQATEIVVRLKLCNYVLQVFNPLLKIKISMSLEYQRNYGKVFHSFSVLWKLNETLMIFRVLTYQVQLNKSLRNSQRENFYLISRKSFPLASFKCTRDIEKREMMSFNLNEGKSRNCDDEIVSWLN